MFILYILLAIISIIVLLFLFYIICSLAVNTKKEYTDNSVFYRSLLNFAAGITTIIFGIKLEITGKEKLDPNKKYFFVSNHRSNLDPILTWYSFKKHNISFVSKPENFKVPIFGNIIHRCCFVTINRSDPFKAIESINKAAQILKKGEISIGAYPEGTRNHEKDMLPFHNGIFKIAQKANVPIAVVSLINTDVATKNFPFKRTKVYIDVLEIIPQEEVKGKLTNIIGDRVREILENKLNQNQ